MEKVLEVDNGIKQMQDVVYSKAPEWKKCYRKQSRIYRSYPSPVDAFKR
uniref:Uncharacterized protein n=1 Tax=Schistosoma haematobium TaxID=6185 RepID=A0A094ZJM6_SCHHA